MKIVAIVEYHADRSKVDQFRPEHRAYCAQLKESGQLAASGPLTDGFGGLFIFEVDSIAAAEQLLQADPFQREGIFKSWKIHPWTIVMSNRESF